MSTWCSLVAKRLVLLGLRIASATMPVTASTAQASSAMITTGPTWPASPKQIAPTSTPTSGSTTDWQATTVSGRPLACACCTNQAPSATAIGMPITQPMPMPPMSAERTCSETTLVSTDTSPKQTPAAAARAGARSQPLARRPVTPSTRHDGRRSRR